jgi:phytoene dehydrogenase-like protein
MALASPFFRAFDLAARGVELVSPEISYAQPLDGGRSAVAYRDLARTAEALGTDRGAWLDLFDPLVDHAVMLTELILGNRRELPKGLASTSGVVGVAAAARRMIEQGSPLWNRRFRTPEAAALLTGVAAHAIAPLPSPAAAGTSILLATHAHIGGWPIAVGGSGAITAALLDDLERHGGRIRTANPVTSWRQLPRARAYLADVTPRALVSIWGERMNPRVRRALSRFRYGNAAAKVDLVLDGPVPWADEAMAEAGTVHLAGTREEMARAEADVAAGRVPESPVVLFSDPATHDPSRESGGLRPGWAYAHVPAHCPVDPTEMITRQIERFAPGFTDRVVASRGIPASRMSEHNANYIGGDIAAGAISVGGMAARPRLSANPYAAGIPGVYLCSQSTPPGPSVHGMSGWHAARLALTARFGLRAPSLAPTA